jgi:ketosteroid isomerase-like protein
MSDEVDVLTAERAFFTALVEGDVEALDQILADDFLLIDVMRGAEVPKSALLAVIGSGQLRFDAIEPMGSRVRLYPATAVVIGRTEMRGRFEGTPFSASSRYTHVFVEQQGRWRLVAAQGTQIAPEPAPTTP